MRAAFGDILAKARTFAPGADIRGVLVSPMAAPGAELIIGTKYDDQFGPVIMFGLGGVLVEILKDVSFRVLPISRMRSNVNRRAEGSRPAVGSSHSSSGGSATREAAIPRRVHMPVENVEMRWLVAPSRPTARRSDVSRG